MSPEILDFDVLTVELADKNLIEASAGTGKTYSIGLLVLRLILEKDMPIEQILMVTFTKAAVAELEDRVRKFIRAAFIYCDWKYNLSKNETEPKTDPQIKLIVDKIESGEEAWKRLRKALLMLDETAIFTIHVFCQRCLDEFAFETKQLFRAELTQDVGKILEEEIQQFWRKYVTTTQLDVLQLLMDNNLSISLLKDILNKQMGGKSYVFYDSKKEYNWTAKTQNEFLQKIEECDAKALALENELIVFFQDNLSLLTEKCQKGYAKKSLGPYLNDLPKLVDAFIAKIPESGSPSKYITEDLAVFYERTVQYLERKEENDWGRRALFNDFYAFAIQTISKEVKIHKLRMNLLSFDDLIGNLQMALRNDVTGRLKKGLNQKYKAVFIDEFQDTDKVQYEIFNRAFGEDSEAVSFFIGDPKQSIYGWRSADLNTYFEAKSKVDHIYTMTTNFRSTPDFVAAMNYFFGRTEVIDPFYYDNFDSGQRIDYKEVNAFEGNGSVQLVWNNAPTPAMIVEKGWKNKSLIAERTAELVATLLNDEKSGFKKNDGTEIKRIQPSDFGILVRNHTDANNIKKQLSLRNVPAVTVTKEKILESDEAQDILYLLEAMAHNSIGNIYRVLLSSLTPQFNKDNFLKFDAEQFTEQFRDYRLLWQEKGIYPALISFFKDFQLSEILKSDDQKDGERIITNFFHLTELLHKTANRQKMAPEELIAWLKINRNLNQGGDEDEQEMRMESDDEAVKIVTIHNSKGLQYNIVLAPYLDFTFKADGQKLYEFRDEAGDYWVGKLNEFTEEQVELVKRQNEQENRRLLYVAITRAIYHCSIFKNSAAKESSLDPFVNELQTSEKLEVIQATGEVSLTHYRPINKPQTPQALRIQHFQIQHPYWWQMSYSSLASHHPKPVIGERLEAPTDYDRFIFYELTKGAKTGTMLHEIFEHLHFDEEQQWSYVIQNIIEAYHPKTEADLAQQLNTFLHQILDTNLRVGEATSFKLSELKQEEHLSELEFDFPVGLFEPQRLADQLQSFDVGINEQLIGQSEGMMNGKVDLFFKKKGQFYVLDWKSNHLGYQLSDYSREKVLDAMSNNNYHLQYLIYTVAVKKYLESRLGNNFDYERDFGGVFYLFVRGMRNGKDTGIFFTKPPLSVIEELETLFLTPSE